MIVDYIGIFDDVAQALAFDEKAVQQVVTNIDELRRELPAQVRKCLAFFPSVDRTVGGYEGLSAAQLCLPNNETRDGFAAEYTVLGRIWEALSPDACLTPHETDFRWLTQVYESVKPTSGNGRLLWHALGAKTVDLINQNVHVESVRDDLDALVLDADVLDGILKDAEPARKGREIEIKLIARLRRHAGNPKFTALGERLERIRERHEQGFLNSLDFLKEMLELAREVVEAEKAVDPVEERIARRPPSPSFSQRRRTAARTSSSSASSTTSTTSSARFASPTGSIRPRESGSSRRSSGRPSSSISCTATRSCSTRLTVISGSTTEGTS